MAMQLRQKVTAPERFEDLVDSTASLCNGTRPAFPRLLKGQVVPFNPYLPPAAFPTLQEPLPASSHAPTSKSIQANISIDESGHGESLKISHNDYSIEDITMTDTAEDVLSEDVFRRAMESSDEEGALQAQTSTEVSLWSRQPPSSYPFSYLDWKLIDVPPVGRAYSSIAARHL